MGNVNHLTSLVKEALDIKKEVGEEKDNVSSAVKVEVKVPLATPEVSSLTKKVESSPADDEVVIVKEVIAKKFGDMTLSDYNSEEDDEERKTFKLSCYTSHQFCRFYPLL